MPTERTIQLMRQYVALRDQREAEYGQLSEAAHNAEAHESANTAMELAGHPVPSGAASEGLHLAA